MAKLLIILAVAALCIFGVSAQNETFNVTLHDDLSSENVTNESTFTSWKMFVTTPKHDDESMIARHKGSSTFPPLIHNADPEIAPTIQLTSTSQEPPKIPATNVDVSKSPTEEMKTTKVSAVNIETTTLPAKSVQTKTPGTTNMATTEKSKRNSSNTLKGSLMVLLFSTMTLKFCC